MIIAAIFIIVGFGLIFATFFELMDEAKIMDEIESHALEIKYDYR